MEWNRFHCIHISLLMLQTILFQCPGLATDHSHRCRHHSQWWHRAGCLPLWLWLHTFPRRAWRKSGSLWKHTVVHSLHEKSLAKVVKRASPKRWKELVQRGVNNNDQKGDEKGGKEEDQKAKVQVKIKLQAAVPGILPLGQEEAW